MPPDRRAFSGRRRTGAPGGAGPALLDSYDAERRPVGEEVVGRTLRHATEGTRADPATLMLRQAQLLVGHHDGPPARPATGGPRPGDRAPDCAGLTTPLAAYPLRLLDVLRGGPGHLAARFPLAEEAAALAAHRKALGLSVA